MPKKKTTILSDKQYPPELKLKIVLEYIQHPRRQQRICEENGISAELLTTWHQEFLTRATQVFSESPSSSAETPIPNTPSSTEAPSPTTIPQSKSTWGVRLNTGFHQSFHSPSSSEMPTWLSGYYRDAWEIRRGLIVWDDQTHVIESMYAWEAV